MDDRQDLRDVSNAVTSQLLRDAAERDARYLAGLNDRAVAAHANRLLGRYEEAVVLYQRSISQKPEHIIPHIGLTACYAVMGRLEDAHTQAAQGLRLDPKFSAARDAQQRPYRLPEHAQRNLDALCEAGRPE